MLAHCLIGYFRIYLFSLYIFHRQWWLSGNALDYQSRGPGFESWSNLGKFLEHFSVFPAYLEA